MSLKQKLIVRMGLRRSMLAGIISAGTCEYLILILTEEEV